MSKNEYFVKVTGKVISINKDAGEKFLMKVRVAISDDEFYLVSFFKQDWVGTDGFVTMPTFMAELGVGKTVTITGREGRGVGVCGEGWLTARRVWYKDGIAQKGMPTVNKNIARKTWGRDELAKVEPNKKGGATGSYTPASTTSGTGRPRPQTHF